MNKQQPMLMESPLTKRVFVVTSYVDNGDGTYTARQKYDVTEQFDALAAARRGECVPHGEWESISQTQEVRHVYCECGYELGMDRHDLFPFQRTELFAMPNFCPECGRKIRKAVKR